MFIPKAKEHVMFIDKIETTLKSIPIADNILLPVINWIRRNQSANFSRALTEFRQYCAALPEVVLDPVFVKVGANDGITGDPCSDILLANTKWRGLLIEPVPYCFDRLQANFHDTGRFSIEQIAIGSDIGKKTFYYVDRSVAGIIPNLPYWFDQIGSFDKRHILKHLNGKLAPFIIECTVDVSTLSSVLKKKGMQNIHLLHIDTEGYDYEVLKSLDFAHHTPLVIFMEHKHLPHAQKKEALCLFRKYRYSVRDCGVDYLAVHKKAHKQLKRIALARHNRYKL